ncbi:MAG TPA: glycerophosphodiester phosphodiesterase [Burkholderiaceae bacterium]|nr:glycerophosphodiester phosphodiesterase [Burkholderiaceae bacterium]
MTTTPWPYPRWIAHRGAGRLAPENTLAAFRLGASHGYRMFECDVKLSQDGVPFLMHDADLRRTTDGSGIGGEQAWQRLSQLDAGSWHSRRYAGEGLPCLENIARFCRHNGHLLNIEIKPTPGIERHTGEVVARHAARLWANAAIAPLMTSFDIAALEGAQATAPALPRGLLLDKARADWLDTARQLACVAVVCHYSLWDTDTVAAAHGAGLRCLSYTVNDEWIAHRLNTLGTDGIITDRIDLFSPA